MPRSWARVVQRRPPRIEPRPKILIVCEGEKTEYGYFVAFRGKENIRLLSIEVTTAHSDPRSVVEHAIAERDRAAKRARRLHDDNERFDEVWCVVDVDEHKLLPQAIALATREKIAVVVSNPCFDLWVLLHVRDQRAQLSAQKVKSACRKHVRNYTGEAPFEDLWPLYGAAHTRALELCKKGTLQPNVPHNPGTHVHWLTERLRELGRNQALRIQLRLTGRR